MPTIIVQQLSNSWSHSCSWCGADLLATEANGWCCTKGKYIVPQLPPYSLDLANTIEACQHLLGSQSRRLNNLFAFTSIGVTGGFRQLPIPSNVAITGRVYHQLHDITEGSQSLRWFLYDEQGHQREGADQGILPELVTMFYQELVSKNPFIFKLRHSFDFPTTQTLTLELRATTTGGDIAALIHSNNLHQVDPRSILIQYNGSLTRQKIDILSPFYEPLQYPIFFPAGTLGWSPDAPMSQIRWYRGLLTTEKRFLQFGRLAGEYLVDMYSRVEDERLSYIRRALQQQMNQIEDFQYSNSQDLEEYSALESYSNRGIVLPASFLGSRAWAASEVADSLALCRTKGKPSFFITITTNPNWPEIQARLAQGQTASDIPVIVCRVFKARLEMAIKAMRKHLGKIIYLIRVVEFQKRGLPHAHLVIKVK